MRLKNESVLTLKCRATSSSPVIHAATTTLSSLRMVGVRSKTSFRSAGSTLSVSTRPMASLPHDSSCPTA
jgi:hypothetical protein